jgi:hypothetical protein
MGIEVLGIDLAKQVFQLHGADRRGQSVRHRRTAPASLEPQRHLTGKTGSPGAYLRGALASYDPPASILRWQPPAGPPDGSTGRGGLRLVPDGRGAHERSPDLILQISLCL